MKLKLVALAISVEVAPKVELKLIGLQHWWWVVLKLMFGKLGLHLLWVAQ